MSSSSLEPENPFTELCEFRLRLVNDDTAQTSPLLATLRLDAMSFDHGETEYNIGITRAYISLNLGGYSACPDSIYGERRLDDVAVQEEFKETHGLLGTASAKLPDADSASPIEGGLSFQASATSTSMRSRSSSDCAIRALPNLRWEIRQPVPIQKNKVWIKGSALVDDTLCHLEANTGANQFSISGEVIVRKKDIEVEAKDGNQMSRRVRVYRNKEAIIGAIAAKALKRHSAVNNLSADDRIITISRHAIEG